jgi:gas vesicle protein
MKNTLNFFAGMIVGAVLGAVTTLLYAPQSGAELRANLQEQANAERQRLQTFYEKQLGELQSQVDKVQKDVQSLLEQTKQTAETAGQTK